MKMKGKENVRFIISPPRLDSRVEPHVRLNIVSREVTTTVIKCTVALFI